MSFDRQENLERVLENVGELPGMPEVLADVLRLMNDPRAEMHRIGATIERDPALAARLLRVSNSAYYGLRGQVSTVKLALVMLGLREVRNIVVAMSLYSAVAGAVVESPLARRLWRHSLVVAGLCRRLGGDLRVGFQGEDFVAGLLHDLGKTVLWIRRGAPYRELLEVDNPAPLFQREEAALGLTHAHVGAALLHNWGLPDALGDAVRLHHPDSEAALTDAEDPPLAALVRIANLAAHDDLDGPTDDAPPQALLDAAAWEILDRLPNPLPPPRRISVLAAHKKEVASSALPELD